MIGESSSPYMSRTRKSAGIYCSWILTMTSLTTPSGNLNDWSAICNWIYVGYKGNQIIHRIPVLTLHCSLIQCHRRCERRWCFWLCIWWLELLDHLSWLEMARVAYDHSLCWERWSVELSLQVHAWSSSTFCCFYCSSSLALIVVLAFLVGWIASELQELSGCGSWM